MNEAKSFWPPYSACSLTSAHTCFSTLQEQSTFSLTVKLLHFGACRPQCRNPSRPSYTRSNTDRNYMLTCSVPRKFPMNQGSPPNRPVGFALFFYLLGPSQSIYEKNCIVSTTIAIRIGHLFKANTTNHVEPYKINGLNNRCEIHGRPTVLASNRASYL